jgi:hypothetical protein
MAYAKARRVGWRGDDPGAALELGGESIGAEGSEPPENLEIRQLK